MAIVLTNVSRLYHVGDTDVVALDRVSLHIDSGAFVAIVGPSGSGKSTMLQILGLLDRPSSGTVIFDGLAVNDLSDAERTRLRLHEIGFVFQRFHLLAGLTAIENVTVPMEAAGVPVRERFDRAAALLTSVDLGDRLDFTPARLSGGERQRVAIARALANEPRLILADEPTGELHSEDRAAVIELLQRFHHRGHTIVVVTHDQGTAAATHHQFELRDGRLQQHAA
ncbi:MAG: ABC transporter ATP-binding protein [Chloroflexi bacterium]|nr:ABC transporter ATP-binding protein [Chloroflexota bacterium]